LISNLTPSKKTLEGLSKKSPNKNKTKNKNDVVKKKQKRENNNISLLFTTKTQKIDNIERTREDCKSTCSSFVKILVS